MMRYKGIEILSSLLSPFYKLGQESTRPENMFDIVLEKAECHGGTVSRMNN